MNGTIMDDCVTVSGARDCKRQGLNVSECAKTGLGCG